MSHRLWVSVAVLLFTAAPVHAQFVVIDPQNLAQAVLIAERARQHVEELRRQHETIQRLARPLGQLDEYRVPAIAITRHNPSRATYGQRWIEGLNSGDATGDAYRTAIVPLEDPSAGVERLTEAGRRLFQRQYATVEITDSVAMMGGHQVALVRGYHSQLQAAVEALERDVLHPLPRYHEMTAVLDKIAAGELLGRRQDMATNQLLSHALEQLLARGKRLRDTEAATVNMQLVTWRDAHHANKAFVTGTGEALRAWRQP
jgi:conjugal transfer/entry exclusion protein